MGSLLSYSLMVSLSVLALYPVLSLLVSRSSWYRFNRYAVLGAIVVSFLLPLAFSFGVESEMLRIELIDLRPTSGDAAVADEAVQNPGGFQYLLPVLVLSVYTAGIIAMLVRQLVSYLSLYGIISVSKKTDEGGYTLCRVDSREISPFSWGRYIVIPSYADEDEAILLHEKSHTRHMHWLDIVLVDLCCIFLWYNPFVWMLRDLMKLNHEYEADHDVLLSGIRVTDYQRMLVARAIVGRTIPIANNFAAGYRNFRRRVLAMNRMSTRKYVWVALLGIPSIIFAGAVLSIPSVAGVLSDISQYRYSQVESKTLPERPETVLATEEVHPAEKTLLPSPIEDPDALREIISVSLGYHFGDKPLKTTLNISLDEDGNVESVDADNPEVKAVVEKELNEVRFEKTMSDGVPVTLRFVIPVRTAE